MVYHYDWDFVKPHPVPVPGVDIVHDRVGVTGPDHQGSRVGAAELREYTLIDPVVVFLGGTPLKCGAYV